MLAPGFLRQILVFLFPGELNISIQRSDSGGYSVVGPRFASTDLGILVPRSVEHTALRFGWLFRCLPPVCLSKFSDPCSPSIQRLDSSGYSLTAPDLPQQTFESLFPDLSNIHRSDSSGYSLLALGLPRCASANFRILVSRSVEHTAELGHIHGSVSGHIRTSTFNL